MIELPAGFTPLDPGRIHLADPFEVEYWRVELGCSAEQLIAVVARVGEHVTAVREALGKPTPAPR